ncbi:MAG TPA: methyltransferase domain-containing protein [Puia sp.]|nr:methyltransferase domain-containing protein [Puia sp.]
MNTMNDHKNKVFRKGFAHIFTERFSLMMPAPEWFREWFDSPYYHKLYFERNEGEATAFIHRLLTVLKPPPGAQMLDVACGRGRHSRILANEGFEVTGIDLAPSSIAYARQFRNDHLDFCLHDMRQILCTNCFDYAFNFFTSFGYFRTQREHENSIRSISLALKREGVFVLDYLNSRYTKDHLIHHSEKVIDGITYDLTRWFDERHFYKKIKVLDEQLPAPLEYTERIARFSPDDFSGMLTRSGLSVQKVYGSYALEPFDIIQSPRLIIIAAKSAIKENWPPQP